MLRSPATASGGFGVSAGGVERANGKRWGRRFGLMVAIAVGAVGIAGQRAPVEVRAPVLPTLIAAADGRAHLAYELHVTNVYQDTGVLRLERIDVFSDPGRMPVLTYDNTALDTRVLHPGAEASIRYRRELDSGRRAIVHVWATLPPGVAAPRRLSHRLLFVDDKGNEQTIEGVPLDLGSVAPLVLGAPLRGGRWLVHNGPGNHRSPHWGSLLARNGLVTIPQRFAVDWQGVDDAGRMVRGEFLTSANEDWVGFGTEVVAVADGLVRGVRDGIVDHAPLTEPGPPADVTQDDVGGNYVVLELNPRTFVYYSHLQRNSVAVRPGDRVVRGQLLGRVGNSGNTNAPHLHFHVGDTDRLEDSEGLPFLLETFELLGETTVERALGLKTTEMAVTMPETRDREMPLDGMIVKLP